MDNNNIFKSEHINKIKQDLENEIQHRCNMLTKYKKIKNTLSVVNKISAVISMTTGTGGIISASIGLFPVSISLDSITVICGMSSLISNKIYDCICIKIEKHRNIKLLAITKLESISKLIAEDYEDEFDMISNHFEEYNKLKLDIQRKNSTI